MKWTSESSRVQQTCFAELPAGVGKAGTSDSVAIISVIWWVARVVS